MTATTYTYQQRTSGGHHGFTKLEFMTPKFGFESFGVLPPENFLKELTPTQGRLVFL